MDTECSLPCIQKLLVDTGLKQLNTVHTSILVLILSICSYVNLTSAPRLQYWSLHFIFPVKILSAFKLK
jgi:hypothetical protein